MAIAVLIFHDTIKVRQATTSVTTTSASPHHLVRLTLCPVPLCPVPLCPACTQVEDALKLGGLDFCVKFCLYFIHERLWAAL